jgi:non-specific serine/threonine protein kinase
MMASNRIPVLTPQGHLKLAPTDEARILPDNLRDRLESAFERGAGHGLLELGIREVGTALPADFAYWREFAGRYVTMLCTSAQPDGGANPAPLSIIAAPPAETLAALASAAPPMPGGEYLNADVLAAKFACVFSTDDRGNVAPIVPCTRANGSSSPEGSSCVW